MTAIDGSYKLESTGCSSGKARNTEIISVQGVSIQLKSVELTMVLKNGKASAINTYDVAGTKSVSPYSFN